MSFVLNNTAGQTIPEATRRRVLTEAARLGYRPHQGAQALRRGRSKVILFVLPDWAPGLALQQHLNEAALALDEAGYALVTCARYTAGRVRPLWELLTPDVVIGVSSFTEEELASMRACGITRIVPEPGRPITLDDWPVLTEGPTLQIEHLYQLGHRRIGFATTGDPRTSLLLDTRVRAAGQAAARLGLDPLDVQQVDHDGVARAAVGHWHAGGVTAVAAYNDDIAAMVVGAAIRSGLAVPAELAVIGHDDTPLATLFVPSISTVRIHTVNLARDFVAFALHQADGRPLSPGDSRADATVVVRESTTAGPTDPTKTP